LNKLPIRALLVTPTPDNVAFVARHARGLSQKFALMILLKLRRRLDYFPDLTMISGTVISHTRSVMAYWPVSAILTLSRLCQNVENVHNVHNVNANEHLFSLFVSDKERSQIMNVPSEHRWGVPRILRVRERLPKTSRDNVRLTPTGLLDPNGLPEVSNCLCCLGYFFIFLYEKVEVVANGRTRDVDRSGYCTVELITDSGRKSMPSKHFLVGRIV